MATKLDLRLTDKVFVLGHGEGEVVRVLDSDGGYVVSVPGRGEQRFSVYGTIGGATDRRLFYHNPILVDPPKDKRFWGAYRALTYALYNALVSMRENGRMPDGPDG
jgi:hypothetical protein